MRAAPLILAMLAGPLLAGSWETGRRLALPVAGHAARIDHENVVWVAGGSVWRGDEKKIVAAIWRHGRDGYWQDVGSVVGGYAHGAAVATKEAWWLVGGFDGAGISRTIRRIELPDARSTPIAELPEPRVYCGAAELAGAIWVIGGTPRDGEFAAAPTTVFRIDPGAGTVRAAATPGPAIINPLVLAFGDELHVLPGGVWSKEHRRLDPPGVIWVFSPAHDRWETRPIRPAVPRGLAGVKIDANRAWVGGGVIARATGAEISAAAWIYDARTSTFSPAPPLPAGRLAAAVVFDRGYVHVLGGEDRPRGRTDTVWRMEIR